jgi:2-phosphoglycolate phosphatase
VPLCVVVFDLDGTLVDSGADIASATNVALGRHGFAELEVTEILHFVGDGARLLLARASRLDPADARLEPLLASFLEHYSAHAVDQTGVLPGAFEALDALSDFTLAICTNKPRKTSEIVIERLGLAPRFAALIAGGDLPQHKPDPAPLHELARRFNCAPEALVMVGDGPQDVECGRRAGARTVGVLGGIADPARLRAAEPDALIASLHELPPLVHGWSGPRP